MPQEPALLARAKRMRHEATPFEVMLWRHLSNSQLGGHKFRRQHVIGSYITDFFCPAKKLIVEIDGDTHDIDSDVRRDCVLSESGCRILRFKNAEIGSNLEGVLSTILSALNKAPSRWAAPHPNPSPEGAGL